MNDIISAFEIWRKGVPEYDWPEIEFKQKENKMTLNDMAYEIHQNAIDKGFWWEERNIGELIALMHSELSEALEATRHGNPVDEHCPEFRSFDIELADCIIRILDVCGNRGMDIDGAITAKMEFNKTRPVLHDKKF